MSGFLLLHSLLTSVLPYICFTVALNYVEAGKVAILASGEPIAAMLFGIFFYQEIPTICLLYTSHAINISLYFSRKFLHLQKNNDLLSIFP